MILSRFIAFILFAYFILFSTTVFAIEYDDNFNANKIVSDYLLYNDTSSMDLSKIQLFLESKGSYLATYRAEDSQGVVKSAAEMIYDAAQTYQINPQAILVLLQKEQGLIQNSAPSQKRIDWATGYAVCDRCSLDSPKVQKYKGFGKQVDNGAGALRFYKENMKKYEYIKHIGQSYIIDAETITPENFATASLYTYTPHILGNYNYWRIWQRYFGNPLAESSVELDATIQTTYMAQIVDAADPQLDTREGEESWYWVEFLNMGTMTWNNEDLKSVYLLDTSKKDLIPMINESSTFDSIALEKEIIDADKIYAQKKLVAPGEILRVSIPISFGIEKKQTQSYILVIENRGWLPGTMVSYELTRIFNYDAELIDDSMPEFSEENTAHNIKVAYKNVGIKPWRSGEVFLDWNDKTKKIQAIISMDQKIVNPGTTATFTLVTKIKGVDTYLYDLSLVRKISSSKYDRFLTGGHKPVIQVRNGLAAQVIDFQLPESIAPGKGGNGRLTIKNVGGVTWKKDELVLRSYTSLKPYKRSVFYNNSWHSGFAVEKIKETIKPGDTYTFDFTMIAPKQRGTYDQYFQLEFGSSYKEVVMDGKDLYKMMAISVGGHVSSR